MEPQVTVLIEGDPERVAGTRASLAALGLTIAEAEQDRGIAETAVGAITWLIKMTIGSKEFVTALLKAAKQPTVSIKVRFGGKVVEVNGAHQAAAVALLERIQEMAAGAGDDE